MLNSYRGASMAAAGRGVFGAGCGIRVAWRTAGEV